MKFKKPISAFGKFDIFSIFFMVFSLVDTKILKDFYSFLSFPVINLAVLQMLWVSVILPIWPKLVGTVLSTEYIFIHFIYLFDFEIMFSNLNDTNQNWREILKIIAEGLGTIILYYVVFKPFVNIFGSLLQDSNQKLLTIFTKMWLKNAKSIIDVW